MIVLKPYHSAPLNQVKSVSLSMDVSSEVVSDWDSGGIDE